MSIQNRNENQPEIVLDFEDQSAAPAPDRLLEVREPLYGGRVTTWYEFVPSGYREG